MIDCENIIRQFAYYEKNSYLYHPLIDWIFIDAVVTAELSWFGRDLKIEGIRYRNYSWFVRLILLLFYLYSNQKGKVLGSGHAQIYQDSLTDIETQWVNGISIWRIETLQSYGFISSKLSYSAYEDVIFSYGVSRDHPIIFASKVIVKSQDSEEIQPITLNQFKSGSYMRYFFVSKYPNLSRIKLLIAQLLRNVQFTLFGAIDKPWAGFF
jgi:hypothetical protein